MLIPPALNFLISHAKIITEIGGSVLDFGDQRLFDQYHALMTLPSIDTDIFNALDDYEQVTEIYSQIGLKNRECLDYNKNANIRVDLNYSITGNKAIESNYSLVTNQGFSEHVFNQFSVFEAIHHCCKEEGYMWHVLPCQGWADGEGYGHGFYQYQPNFFRHLAKSNNYELIDMKVSLFSPHHTIYSFDKIKYPIWTNPHLIPKEDREEIQRDKAMFMSLLVLMKMPVKKVRFTPPHE